MVTACLVRVAAARRGCFPVIRALFSQRTCRQVHRGVVGSALIDTIQQAAALGVAILGSLATSSCTSAMPATAPEEARRSVAAAVADPSLAAAARQAYDAAMSTAFLGAAAGVLGAAVLALLLLRGRKIGAHVASTIQQQTPVSVTH